MDYEIYANKLQRIDPLSKKNELQPGMHVFKHRYKWTTEEKSVVGVLFALFAAAAVVAVVRDMSAGWFIIAGFCFFFFGYALWLGTKRKRESTMSVIFSEKELKVTVEGNKYESSKHNMELFNVRHVGIRQLGSKAVEGDYGPRDVLVFNSVKSRTMSIPLRLLANDDLYKLLIPTIEKYGNEDVIEAAKFGHLYKG